MRMEIFSNYVTLLVSAMLAVCGMHGAEAACSKEAQSIIDSNCNLTTTGLTLANIAQDKRAAIVKEVRDSNKCPQAGFLYENFTMSQMRNSAQDLIYSLWVDSDRLCVAAYKTETAGLESNKYMLYVIVVAVKDKLRFRSMYNEMYHSYPEDAFQGPDDAPTAYYMKTITMTGPSNFDCKNPAAVAQRIMKDTPNLKTPEGKKTLESVYFSLSLDCIIAVQNAYTNLNSNCSKDGMLDDLNAKLPKGYADLYNTVATSLTFGTDSATIASYQHYNLISDAFSEASYILRLFDQSVCYVDKCASYEQFHETLKEAIANSRGEAAFKVTADVFIDYCCDTYGKKECKKSK